MEQKSCGRSGLRKLVVIVPSARPVPLLLFLSVPLVRIVTGRADNAAHRGGSAGGGKKANVELEPFIGDFRYTGIKSAGVQAVTGHMLCGNAAFLMAAGTE